MALESSSFNLTFTHGFQIEKTIFSTYYFDIPSIFRTDVHTSYTSGLQFKDKPLNTPAANNTEFSFSFDTLSSSDLNRLNSLMNMQTTTSIYGPNYSTEFKTISGKVTRNDVISPYASVVLHDRLSGSVIKRATTDVNGEFIFTDIPPALSCYVVSFDDKGEMNAVILSGVRT